MKVVTHLINCFLVTFLSIGKLCMRELMFFSSKIAFYQKTERGD
ncbi:hypothetical protein P5673_018295 [Acropora cervicornis]|uniref:Uncharacterized protein n=1 Tax=Acropora cervicornis TaxID=6130 RepID=A0AAD9QD92_ACRCE|nr:hypothetical protein P5673_018295 [Acropora cervicornis]